MNPTTEFGGYWSLITLAVTSSVAFVVSYIGQGTSRQSQRVLLAMIPFILILLAVIDTVLLGNAVSTLLKEYDGLLTIVGWLLVIMFGFRHLEAHLKNESKLSVYHELAKDVSDLSEVMLDLLNTISKFNVEQAHNRLEWMDKGHEDYGGAKSHYEVWSSLLKGVLDATSKFVTSYRVLWGHVDDRTYVLPSLAKAKSLLFQEFTALTNELWKYHHEWQPKSLEAANHAAWKEESVAAIAALENKAYRVVGFLNDFLVLAHNELVGELFGALRRIERFDHLKKPGVFDTLTRDGIVRVNIEPGKAP